MHSLVLLCSYKTPIFSTKLYRQCPFTVTGENDTVQGIQNSANRVFSEDEFDILATELRKRYSNGETALFSQILNVQCNHHWSIEGGWKVCLDVRVAIHLHDLQCVYHVCRSTLSGCTCLLSEVCLGINLTCLQFNLLPL
jgi:hypothetical protein